MFYSRMSLSSMLASFLGAVPAETVSAPHQGRKQWLIEREETIAKRKKEARE